MKIFISSVISGMEPERDAVKKAVASLGYTPLMAESFHAQAQSPQVACLEGVRQADMLVLVLGASYGRKQQRGLSATHEEYREARDQKPVLAFVAVGINAELDQREFIEEVERWESGLYRGTYTSPDDLQTKVTVALHQTVLSLEKGPVDEAALVAKARSSLQQQRGYSYREVLLQMGIAPGPIQAVLRPKELESGTLARSIIQVATFGDNAIFDHRQGTDFDIESDALVIQQEKGASITLKTDGSMVFSLWSLNGEHGRQYIIEEKLQIALSRILRLSDEVLNLIDGTRRLTNIAIVAQLSRDIFAWRTQVEHDRNPSSFTMNFASDKHPVMLTPPTISRSRLRNEAESLAEDILVLMRRQVQQK